jgi:hypothetical protein
MKDIRELLQDADPLRSEGPWPSNRHDSIRQAVLEAASRVDKADNVRSRSRIAVFTGVALMAIAAMLVGVRVSSLLFVSGVQAAVRFEARLAEDRPAPGLQKAKVSGTDRFVYLHEGAIVTNADISDARIVPASKPSRYSIDVEFNASGAEKMRAATEKNIGKHIAILLDGQVVMTPVFRTPIAASARIDGDFTRTQAERIVNGIKVQ